MQKKKLKIKIPHRNTLQEDFTKDWNMFFVMKYYSKKGLKESMRGFG